MKDYITITSNDNSERQVEVICIFTLSGYDYNYLIYKELDGSHNYIAKYKGEDIVSLDTNLSDEELKIANVIYEGVRAWA